MGKDQSKTAVKVCHLKDPSKKGIDGKEYYDCCIRLGYAFKCTPLKQ